MNKVYVIRYEDYYGDCCATIEYASGTSYVFSTLEKAKAKLNQIKQEELASHEGEDTKDIITNEDGKSFRIDYYDGYTDYIIDEMEVE